ncbi:MAG: hypothetical protein ACM3JK_01110 [Betaproteobacteria bacterium]
MRFAAGLLFPAALLAAASVQAAPLLRCHLSYAGITHILEAAPGSDPYGVEARDIGGRFRFKAVVIGNDRRVDYIKLYAYYQAERQPVLLHEARYTPPFAATASPYDLTGLNFLYSPDLGRELQYGCTLEGVQP